MLRSTKRNITLLPSELEQKRSRDVEYLNWLDLDELLFSFREEAGLLGPLSAGTPTHHGGWDGPCSQIRGTFTGHWLTSMSNLYEQTNDLTIKGKVNYIIDELEKCQKQNGHGWVFSIPEKYLFGLRDGKHFWAPYYVCHKELRGIFDAGVLTENEKAFVIIDKATDWFIDFTKDLTQEDMKKQMDLEETGGILELWADLFEYTGNKRYSQLINKFTRYSLFDALLKKDDIFTNMHANITIPEVHGLARVYEVTKDERYKEAVLEYWHQVVDIRGLFASGGQTVGEVWTPPRRQLSRLGDMNQEHCVVFNMIVLAEYLYRWTKETKYHDFIEKNLYNGVFAQTFWQNRRMEQLLESEHSEEGIAAYFLPLGSGSQKKWSNRLDQFWCCHCTAVEVNTKTSHWLSYYDDQAIYLMQYFSHAFQCIYKGTRVDVKIEYLEETGEINHVFEEALKYERQPDYDKYRITLSADKVVEFDLVLRIPEWCENDYILTNCELSQINEQGTLRLSGKLEKSLVFEVAFHRRLRTYPLTDAPNYQAVLDGPVLLAGLIPDERTIYVKREQSITDLMVPREERTWNHWNHNYQITGQPVNFILRPLKDIGNEMYCVYFPVEEKQESQGQH